MHRRTGNAVLGKSVIGQGKSSADEDLTIDGEVKAPWRCRNTA